MEKKIKWEACLKWDETEKRYRYAVCRKHAGYVEVDDERFDSMVEARLYAQEKNDYE